MVVVGLVDYDSADFDHYVSVDHHSAAVLAVANGFDAADAVVGQVGGGVARKAAGWCFVVGEAEFLCHDS